MILNWLTNLQIEKAKQDDGLDDLSNLLSQMKGVAVDMGTELEKWALKRNIG